MMHMAGSSTIRRLVKRTAEPQAYGMRAISRREHRHLDNLERPGPDCGRGGAELDEQPGAPDQSAGETVRPDIKSITNSY